MRGRSVYKNTSGLHSCGEFREDILFGKLVDIYRGGVTVAAVRDEVFRLVERVVNVLCAVHSEYRRELFVSEFFADIDLLYLADKYFCSFGNVNSRKSGNSMRLLTDDLCVERTVYYDSMAYLVRFGGGEEVAAACRKFRSYLVVYLVKHDDRLLRSADHTVVKSL